MAKQVVDDPSNWGLLLKKGQGCLAGGQVADVFGMEICSTQEGEAVSLKRRGVGGEAGRMAHLGHGGMPASGEDKLTVGYGSLHRDNPTTLEREEKLEAGR